MSIDSPERNGLLPESQQHNANATDQAHSASKQEAPAGVQGVEPEDVSLKGHTAAEQNRLLKQNVQGRSSSEERPDTPSGQHATGSKASG
jgi:hypothetical protein